MTGEASHDFTDESYGWITHTDLASADPDATRAWCAEVFGWTFHGQPAPGGTHLFAYSDRGGGGIRGIAPDDESTAIPYVHVRDTTEAFDTAIAAGAEPLEVPAQVMEGVSTALVQAPGGVVIGLSGPSSDSGTGDAAERTGSGSPSAARVEHTLAVVAVSDIDASRSWYEWLLGGPPTNTPMPTLVEWRTTPNGWLQVLHDPDKAGNSLANLAVNDIDSYVANLAARGLGPVEIVDAAKGVRLATLDDPDGNAITLIGNFRETY